jgi:hypothetical protein
LELVWRVDRRRTFGGELVGRVALRRACEGRGLFSYISLVRVCLCVYMRMYMYVDACMNMYLFRWVIFSWSVHGRLHLHTYYVARVGKRA